MKKFLLLMVAIVFGNVAMAQRIYDRVGDYYEGLAKVAGYTSVNGWSLKYGFVNEYNQLVIPLKFEDAGHFVDGVAWVSMGEKCGYINKKGVVITPIIYDNAHEMVNGFGLVELNGKYGCVNKTGKLILPCKFSRINLVTDDVIYASGGGYYDNNGNNFVPSGYENGAKAFRIGNKNGKDEYLYVVCKGDYEGVIDRNGKIIIPAKYKSVGGFRADDDGNCIILEVSTDDGKGLVKVSGKEIIPPKYNKIYRKGGYKGNEDVFCAETDTSIAIFSPNGEELFASNVVCKLNEDFERAGEFTAKYILVENDGKRGLMNNSSMDFIMECVYDSIESIEYQYAYSSTNYLFIKKDGKCGVFNKVKEQPQLLYDDIQLKNNGIYFVKDNKYGYCKNFDEYDFSEQKPKFDCIYDQIEMAYMYENSRTTSCLILKKDGLWGAYIRSSTPEIYSSMKPELVEKGIMLDKNGKIGIINSNNGSEVFPFEYEISEPSDGMVKVKKGNYYTFVPESFKFGSNVKTEYSQDKFTGTYFVFDEANDFHEGVAAVKYGKKWGYASKSMTWVIKPSFDSAGDFNNGKALVTKGGKEFYIGKDGKKIK